MKIIAGADIIETSTYQATLEGFNKHLDLDYGKGEELMFEAVVLAKKALDEFMKHGIHNTHAKLSNKLR